MKRRGLHDLQRTHKHAVHGLSVFIRSYNFGNLVYFENLDLCIHRLSINNNERFVIRRLTR